MDRSPYAPGGVLSRSGRSGVTAGLSLDLAVLRLSVDGKSGKITATSLSPGSLAFSMDVCKPTNKSASLSCSTSNDVNIDQIGAEYSPTILKMVTIGGNKDTQCTSIGFGFNFGVNGNVLGPPIPLN